MDVNISRLHANDCACELSCEGTSGEMSDIPERINTA
jgi:hypothetical protein